MNESTESWRLGEKKRKLSNREVTAEKQETIYGNLTKNIYSKYQEKINEKILNSETIEIQER